MGLATIALLWDQLGEVKRAQANWAICQAIFQYRPGSVWSRIGRRTADIYALVERPRNAAPSQSDLNRAWAAGFLDGEGCFGVVRSYKRKRGPVWHRVRVSATQHGLPGVPPAVLVRLQQALEGTGRIERHGGSDDFKWLAETDARVQRVLDLVSPWLSDSKREDAHVALARFREQVRFRGDGETCLRGHPYSRRAMRGGRLRWICNACARLTSAERRAWPRISSGPL